MIRSMKAAAVMAALTLGTTVPASAQGAPCAPSFKAIHDFKVGDIFQYRIWKRSGDPNSLLARGTETIRKYRIITRQDSGDVTTYGLFGLARISEMENGRVLSSTLAPYSEDLRFVDSAGHRLNRCHGDIVPFPELGAFSGAHTRVRIVAADTQRFRLARPGEKLKILGEELGVRIDDTTLVPIMDAAFSLTYAEGLGLIERSEGGMMSIGYSEALTGYVRNGKTHGVLDPTLVVVLGVRPGAARDRPVSALSAWPFVQGEEAFDLRGRRTPFRVAPLR